MSPATKPRASETQEEQAATKIQAVHRGNHARHRSVAGPGASQHRKAPTGQAARPHEGVGALASVDAQGFSMERWAEAEYAKLSLEELQRLCKTRGLSTAGEREQLIRRLLGYDCLTKLALEELQLACKEWGLSPAGGTQSLILRLLGYLGKLTKEELQEICRERNLSIDGEAGELLLRIVRHWTPRTKDPESGGKRAEAARGRAEEKERVHIPSDDVGTHAAVLHVREQKEKLLIHYPKLRSLQATMQKLEDDKERWEKKFGRTETKLTFLSRLLAEFKHEHVDVGWSPAALQVRQQWWVMHTFLNFHYLCLEHEAENDSTTLRVARMQKMKALKDVGAAGEQRDGLESLFGAYTSLTIDGKELMRRPDWAHFLHDFHEAHPKVKGFKDVEHLMRIWDEYIDLQKDLCATYSMERSEAAKGLCFDSFQAALHSVIPYSFYHQSYN